MANKVKTFKIKAGGKDKNNKLMLFRKQCKAIKLFGQRLKT